MRITKEKITPDEVLQLINDPDIEFTMTPQFQGQVCEFFTYKQVRDVDFSPI